MYRLDKIKETKKNFIDATSFREPKKVPVGADIYGWAFHYAGVSYEEVIDDPHRCAEAFCKFLDDLPLDFTISDTIPAPASIRATQALGMQKYIFTPDRTAVVHNQIADVFIGPEVYDMIIEDCMNFQTEVMPKHWVPAFSLPRDEAYEALKRAAMAQRTYEQTNRLVSEHIKDRGIYALMGTEEMMNSVIYSSPFDSVFNSYRGIVDSMLDLRRRKEKVLEACDALHEYNKMFAEYDVEVMKSPLPFGSTYYFSEGFLSRKQYEELYFRYFKEDLLPLLQAGKKMWLLAEGNCSQTFDYFRELPKGSMVIQIDGDDSFEVYDKIGDWCSIATGITLDLLQLGTIRQCKDHVKRSFDSFAPGGGFIFMPNKELICGKDAKIENVIAVFEEADMLSR